MHMGELMLLCELGACMQSLVFHISFTHLKYNYKNAAYGEEGCGMA